jgi:hypothetical protein
MTHRTLKILYVHTRGGRPRFPEPFLKMQVVWFCNMFREYHFAAPLHPIQSFLILVILSVLSSSSICGAVPQDKLPFVLLSMSFVLAHILTRSSLTLFGFSLCNGSRCRFQNWCIDEEGTRTTSQLLMIGKVSQAGLHQAPLNKHHIRA